MAYESYYAGLSVSHSTPAEYYKDFHRELYSRGFDDAATVRKICHNGKWIKVRIVGIFSAESPTRRMEEYQKIIFQDVDYIVGIGDIFRFDKMNWLCVDISVTPTTKSCMVAKCEYEMEIYPHKVPIFIDPKVQLYKLGIDNNRFLPVPLTTMIAEIPANAITANVELDNIYSIGFRNWRVTDINDVLKHGLLILKLEFASESQPQPPTPPPPHPKDGVIIVGEDEIRFGQVAKYQVIRYVGGEEDTEAKFTFSIIGADSGAYGLTVIDSRNCKIEGKGYPHTITLRAMSVDTHDDLAQKEIKLKGLL